MAILGGWELVVEVVRRSLSQADRRREGDDVEADCRWRHSVCKAAQGALETTSQSRRVGRIIGDLMKARQRRMMRQSSAASSSPSTSQDDDGEAHRPSDEWSPSVIH